MKKILIFLIILFLIFNCSKDNLLEPDFESETETDNLGECPDTRLIGTWKYYFYTNWNDGLYEIHEYEKWTFDNNNNKCSQYSKYWSYTESGWVNATKGSHFFYLEWEIVDNKLRSKLWGRDDLWNEESFEYINSTKIKIDFKEYIKQ